LAHKIGARGILTLCFCHFSWHFLKKGINAHFFCKEEAEVEIVEPEYNPPSEVLGAFLFENFQDEAAFEKTWTHSTNPEFSGQFQVGTGGW
jgi:hypothetical protein